jgi:ribosomal protein S18 acetylase RimI-like enzyme
VRDTAFTVRNAEPADIPDLIWMKRELATAEDTLVVLRATPEDWLRDLFGKEPRFIAFVATRHGSNIGMATCSERYFTGWVGPTIYLQDLFVEAAHRRRGVGAALIARVGAYAHERGSPMVELTMRADNPACLFYRRHGFQKVQNCAVYVAGTQTLLATPSSARQMGAP